MRCICLVAILTSSVFAIACTSAPKPTPKADGATAQAPSKIVLPIDKTVSATEAGVATVEDGVTVVRLTQRPCRFVQGEPGASFDSIQSFEACKANNAKTLADRKQQALRIPAGKVRFVVSSEQVPYTLGFWIRNAETPKTPIAQGGGITAQTPKTYDVELKPGTYVYACPLNPTPDYTIIVE